MTSIITIALTGFLIWSGAPTEASALKAEALKAVVMVTEMSSVKLTGYNAVPEQTDNDPYTTASGAFSNPAVIVARSRDMAEALPYGTVISINNPKDDKSCGFDKIEHLVGYRVVADTTHVRKIRQIDVMFDDRDMVLMGAKKINPAIIAGVCDVTVRVVGKIAIKDIPKTQAELAMLIEK